MGAVGTVSRRVLFWGAGVCLLLPVGARLASADRVVNANEPVIISDDITDRTQNVESASGGFSAGVPAGGGEDGSTEATPPGGDETNPSDPAEPSGGSDGDSGDLDGTAWAGDDDPGTGHGNDDNRSGLGDGTNPGHGAGRENSPNEGTDNPNQAKK